MYVEKKKTKRFYEVDKNKGFHYARSYGPPRLVAGVWCRRQVEFKVMIFHDKCRRAGLPEHAYMQGASIMLSGQALTHYYANRVDATTFNHLCTSMRTFFEGLEWQRLNLTKCQTIHIQDLVAANPNLSLTEFLYNGGLRPGLVR